MAAMPGSAGLVTLLPSDQSYPSASRIEGNTSARQRRRKTTRNPDSKKSTRGNLTENGLELVSLESSGSRSPRDWPRTGVSRGRGNPEESRGVDSPAVPLGSSGLQGKLPYGPRVAFIATIALVMIMFNAQMYLWPHHQH